MAITEITSIAVEMDCVMLKAGTTLHEIVSADHATKAIAKAIAHGCGESL